MHKRAGSTCTGTLGPSSPSGSNLRPSDLRKRAGSTCTGTLGPSSPSGSNLRPFDLHKRAGSTSSGTLGPSSSPFYGKRVSSKVIRSPSIGQGKNKPDLRCF